jgi:hypothetical protein
LVLVAVRVDGDPVLDAGVRRRRGLGDVEQLASVLVTSSVRRSGGERRAVR